MLIQVSSAECARAGMIIRNQKANQARGSESTPLACGGIFCAARDSCRLLHRIKSSGYKRTDERAGRRLGLGSIGLPKARTLTEKASAQANLKTAQQLRRLAARIFAGNLI